MKTKIFIVLFTLWLFVSAFSFKINILGYDISYNARKEVNMVNKTIQSNADIPTYQGNNNQIIKMPIIAPKPVHEFDNDIQNLNEIQEVRNVLMQLGYSRIGFTDEDTNSRYVASINNMGYIITIYQDKQMYADVELRGSLQKIKDYAYRRDYERLKLAIDMPIKTKLRILVNQWF